MRKLTFFLVLLLFLNIRPIQIYLNSDHFSIKVNKLFKTFLKTMNSGKA